MYLEHFCINFLSHYNKIITRAYGFVFIYIFIHEFHSFVTHLHFFWNFGRAFGSQAIHYNHNHSQSLSQVELNK